MTLFKSNNSNKIEPYDDRYTGYTLHKCAKWCKETENCYGIAYDPINQICYPSKSPISDLINVPESSLYRSEFDKDNVSCNKLQPVITSQDVVSFEDRRKNSVFICKENDKLQPQWYLHRSDKDFLNLGEGKNIDELFDIDLYSVRPYRWPINRYSQDQIDLLRSDLNKSNIHVSDVNNIKPVIKFKIEPEPSFDEPISLDFGLERIRRLFS